MDDKNNDSKLATTLVHGQKPKTSTREKTQIIKFTDYAISRATLNQYDKNGNKKYRRFAKFDGIKGLYLQEFENQKTGKTTRYFTMKIWFNNAAVAITLGQVEPGYGVTEARNDYNELFKTHRHNGIWVKDPRQTRKDKHTKVTESEIIKSQQLTIREVIIRFCKAGYPLAKRQGALSVNSIKEFNKFMIGYNNRLKLLAYGEDKKGHGRVAFKEYRQLNKRFVAKPESWDDLFKKYPVGHGLVKEKALNPNSEISLYDSELGGLVIDKLNYGIIKRYINNEKRAYGTKDSLLDVIRRLWSFAVEEELFGDVPPVIDFTSLIGSLKKPEESKAVGSKYVNERFTKEQIQVIYSTLLTLRTKYPFTAEALMFMMLTGRRETETLKIEKEMIKENEGIIVLPRGITKSRKEEIIDITPPLAVVLDSVSMHTKGKYAPFQFSGWLFPSPRVNKLKLHNDKYIRSHATRLKSVRPCWEALVRATGIFGSPKMFRKTFSSFAKLTLGTTSKARTLTGHEQDSTLDIYYDKTPREEVKKYANDVAKIFDFVKKTG